MVRHCAVAVCLCLMPLTLSARAQWRNWQSYDVHVAAEDVVQALAERMETTWLGTDVETVSVRRCVSGSPVDVEEVRTNRNYLAYLKWRVPSDTSPIVWRENRALLYTDSLIHYSDQTNAVVTFTNGVWSTNLVVDPLYRIDDVATVTNDNDCATNQVRSVTVSVTGAPITHISSDWLGALDAGIWDTLRYGKWVSGADLTNGDYIVKTNWTWSYAANMWKESSHDLRSPTATPWHVFFELAGLPVITNVFVTDRGESYPRIITNYHYQGWEVGEPSVHVLDPPVPYTVIQERYVTNPVPVGYYHYSLPTDHLEIAGTNSAYGGTNAYGGRILALACIAQRSLTAVQVYGGSVAGVYTNAVFDGYYGYSRAGGGADIRSWTNQPYWQDQRRYLVSGGKIIGDAGGPQYDLPLHACYKLTDESNTYVAARALSVWQYSTYGDFNPAADGGYPALSVSNAALPARMLVELRLTNDYLCHDLNGQLFPRSITASISGSYWAEPTATSSWRRITTNQSFVVSEPGLYNLAYPFCEVLSITTSSASVAAPYGGYDHDGVYIYVLTPAYSNALIAADAPSGMYRYASKSFFEDRKALLNTLRWSLRDYSTTNEQTSELSLNTNRWYTRDYEIGASEHGQYVRYPDGETPEYYDISTNWELNVVRGHAIPNDWCDNYGTAIVSNRAISKTFAYSLTLNCTREMDTTTWGEHYTYNQSYGGELLDSYGDFNTDYIRVDNEAAKDALELNYRFSSVSRLSDRVGASVKMFRRVFQTRYADVVHSYTPSPSGFEFNDCFGDSDLHTTVTNAPVSQNQWIPPWGAGEPDYAYSVAGEVATTPENPLAVLPIPFYEPPDLDQYTVVLTLDQTVGSASCNDSRTYDDDIDPEIGSPGTETISRYWTKNSSGESTSINVQFIYDLILIADWDFAYTP